jgi:high-affinity Fe2+/Pb2+ permease
VKGWVTFREGLEAALVVGILARVVPSNQRWLIGAGVGAAILMSLVAAGLLSAIAATHVLWEIGFSLLAAGLLIYMVGWMRRQERLSPSTSVPLPSTAQAGFYSEWLSPP